jgi:hydroxymethylbilane synthase
LKPLRIGTRASALALWQANYVRDRLQELHGIEVELVRIRTSGDRFQSASFAQLVAQSGRKGLFIKEIEDALLHGSIDLAVHSMKDVPTEIPDGLAIPAIPPRGESRDCLISLNGQKLADMPRGARVGTSSLRRQAQIRHNRPDLQMIDLRGNVDTRIRKLASGEFDAVVLAMAGLLRLGMEDKITEILAPEVMLPAVGQGALAVETRSGDARAMNLVAALDDLNTRQAVLAERALLRELEGGCQVPLGAWARHNGEKLYLDAAVFSPDGVQCVRREISGAPAESESLGKRLGKILKEAGADQIMRQQGKTIVNG